MKNLTEWRTTSVAIILILVLGILLYKGVININDASGLVETIIGAISALLLLMARDPQKKEKS
tara:strand:+ start:1213 stop:1401 length:189 start_codon:yes stop_codon:yes gene_type:complete